MINFKEIDHHVHIFSPKLKQKITEQAASMLLQHVTFEKDFYHFTQNSNGNAFDERLHIRRTNKCNSWLSKFPRKSATRFIESHKSSRRFHHNQITLSSNAVRNIDSQSETFSQPLILIHKKRLHCDYFLSTMQNCLHSPYSQNHFYALDQLNMLKLQRNISMNLKRKYSEDESDQRSSSSSSSKKCHPSPPKTADHISINKYHDEIVSSGISDDKQQSQIILSHLEKILNLCGELRSLANDVENHLNEKQANLSSENQEEEIQQIVDEINTPLSYEIINDISSIHSESNKSHQLMQTESFKTKSITSEILLRKPEDICSCFLKSNCRLNTDEQEYLNQLTKAYLLGREQVLEEQHEENNKFQAFLNPNLSEDSNEFNTNNNNQTNTPSSIVFYNNIQKIDDHLSSIPIQSNDSIVTLNQQQLSNLSGVIPIKYQIFLNEPIVMKTTNVLPGIGIKYAEQLAECGFTTIRRLLGFYLMVKNDQNFVDWLNNKVQISIHSAWLCTNALRDWCQAHL